MSADEHDDASTLDDRDRNDGYAGDEDWGPGSSWWADIDDPLDDEEADTDDPLDGEGLAREAAEAVPEVLDAGFLPRDGSLPGPLSLAAGPAAGFAAGDVLDTTRPCVTLAGFADDVTGPDGRCDSASDDQLIGVLRAWDRIQSWAAERKLAVIAELIRRRPAPGCQPAGAGAMPAAWGKFCGDELAAATATSGQAAEKALTLAYDLASRLRGTARALHDGIIDVYKARLIADVTRALDPPDAAAVEARVLRDVASKTPGQLRVAIARAVASVNPGAAQARREKAQRDARVELWREDAGTAALCGRDLPPAEALAADQRITAYARELKAAGMEGTTDQLRTRAFLDLALGVRSHPASPRDRSDPGAGNETGGAAPGRGNPREGNADGGGSPGANTDGGGSPGAANADGAANTDGGGSPGAANADGAANTGIAARINLTIPLTTLLGLAERPGEAGGLGAIDPALARTLAGSAARNPRTTWCVTVTDEHGHPAAHGCARAARGSRPAGGGPGDRGGTAFTREHGNGPPGGYGRWRLRPEGGRELLVGIEPLAIIDCDHRHESAGYEPSDTLRHLVEVRDGECTWPPCRRAARRCDFEHAVPWDQGGRTCACNAGPGAGTIIMRSRLTAGASNRTCPDTIPGRRQPGAPTRPAPPSTRCDAQAGRGTQCVRASGCATGT